MTDSAEDRFRRFLESVLGSSYAGPLDEVARLIGVKIDDPATWSALESRWEAIRPEVEQLGSQDETALEDVESAYQAVIERDADVFDPAVLESNTPGIRMLVATRVIETQVDNGGWPAVFYNGVEGHLPGAIDGYRLLGLADHAALAERVRAHGWIEPDDDAPPGPAWDGFDAAWLSLPDAEEARTRYVKDHPAEFPQ